MALHKTPIGWTDYTTNPVRARDKQTGRVGHWCEKISPACKPCYSSDMQPRRFGMHEFHAANRDKVEVFLDERQLADVTRRRKPAKIFWVDMSDLFGDWVPFPWIRRCFDTMVAAPQHVHQVLTKRPDRVLALASQLPWPPNVWLGVSIESGDYLWRADRLRQVPAAVRFLSLEPLFGPMPGLDLTGIDWVIIGGVSGPRHRDFPPLDLHALRVICGRCAAAGVPVFVKPDSHRRDGQQGGSPTTSGGGRSSRHPPCPCPRCRPRCRWSRREVVVRDRAVRTHHRRRRVAGRHAAAGDV